jgi:hypothetical protein
LVWDLQLPEDLPFRKELHLISDRDLASGLSKTRIPA